MSTFKAKYAVDDGYAGGARPHFVTIDEADLNDCETDEQLLEAYNEVIYDHFTERITPYGQNEAEFLEWAKKVKEAAQDVGSEQQSAQNEVQAG